jgi:putative endonuclease
MNGYTYIMTNKTNSVLYIGATSDLVKRVYTHKNRIDPSSFTARYRIYKLVYYECFDDLELAFMRERRIKNMIRKDKIVMITRFNSKWKDLYDELDCF